jgi:hypothetical protein
MRGSGAVEHHYSLLLAAWTEPTRLSDKIILA